MASITFIVPACNEEDFLPGCLRSIHLQAGDFEVVVVDNNSSDGTRGAATACGARTIICRDQGIGAARNAGMREASTEWLAFVDADAVLSSAWLESAIGKARKDRLDLVSGLNIFDGQSPLQRTIYNSYHVIFYAIFLSLRTAGRPLVTGNNLLIRRQTLIEAGGFPRLVGEDVRLSPILRRKNARGGFSPAMRITYSPRRFESRGFLPTLLLWIRSTLREIPEDTYAMRHERRTQRGLAVSP